MAKQPEFRITARVERSRFLRVKWDDGCEQYCLNAMHHRNTPEEHARPYIGIERVVGTKSRRKMWCIVIRTKNDSNVIYPRRLVKERFKSPEEAEPLYLTLCALHGWRVD